MRSFVAGTAGMVNAWDLASPSPPDERAITGICGEMLRSFRKLPDGPEVDSDLEPLFRPPPSAASVSSGPRSRRASTRSFSLSWRRCRAPGASSFTRLQAHYLHNRMRYTRVGPRDELSSALRVQPLYSLASYEAVLGLRSDERQSGTRRGRAMRRAADVLARHPFTGAGWDDGAIVFLDARPAGPTVGSPHRPAPIEERPGAPGPQGLISQLASTKSDERVDILRAVLTSEGNPLWDIVDQDAALASLERWDELKTNERRELYGAATGVIWMGGPQSEG